MKVSKTSIEYSNNMEDFYKNFEGYNPSRICNVFIVFDNMIADKISSNKKLSPIVTELFITGRNLFITKSYLQVPKDVRLNCTHLYYENSKQTRASANDISSFVRYWL